MFRIRLFRPRPAVGVVSSAIPVAPVPTRVGVVGCGYDTATVFDLLAEAGHPAEFLVNDREGADADPFGAAYAATMRGIPVLAPTALADLVKWTPGGVTLYAGRVESDPQSALADDTHHQLVTWVTTVCGRQLPVRHPVSLVARLPMPPCPQRYAVFGYTGSGNVLAQNLIAGLYSRHPEPPPLAWQMRASLSEQYFNSVAARIRAALSPLAPTRVDFTPHDFGSMVVSVECGPNRAGTAFQVPCQRHLGFRTYPTHSRPTRAAVDYFTSVNAPCVAVVRHPLETILSQANKIARPARVLFDRPDFLASLAAGVAEWVGHLLDNRPRTFVVRYEDLVDRRVGVLHRLAEHLGLHPLTDAEAEGLFDQFLNRNLPSSVPTHFFRGGNDKWRGEYTPQDLRRVLAVITPEMFAAFGYPVPTEGDLTPPRIAAHPSPSSAPPSAPSALDSSLMGWKSFLIVPGRHGIRVTGSDQSLKEGLSAAFQDPELLAMFDAGGLTVPIRAAWAFEQCPTPPSAAAG